MFSKFNIEDKLFLNSMILVIGKYLHCIKVTRNFLDVTIIQKCFLWSVYPSSVFNALPPPQI